MPLRPPGAARWDADRRQGHLPDLGRLIIPLMLPPVPVGGRCFMTTSVVASLALSLVFQLAHCVEEAEFIDPEHIEDGPHAWQIHQIEIDRRLREGQQPAALLRRRPEPPDRAPPVLAPATHAVPADRADRGGRGASPRHHLHPSPHLRMAMRSHTQWLKLMGTPPPRLRRPSVLDSHRPHVPLGVMRPVAVYRYRYVIRPRSRS